MQKKKRARQAVGGAVTALLGLALCGGFGVVFGMVVGDAFGGEMPQFGVYLLLLALALFLLYFAIFLQTVLHEAGHLVFGLLTGYRFLSFRVGSFVWLREGGRLRCKRLTLAGTAGQCLLSPPELVDGRMPYVLYNLGGVIMNLVTGALFLGLFLLCRGVAPVALFSLAMAGTGGLFALTNGIPLRAGPVDNDGRNALELGRSPGALEALWVQLKANELIARGVPLGEMPQEWFDLPPEEDWDNSMVAARAVFRENWLMEREEFREAAQLADRLLERAGGLPGVYRGLLKCDRLTCELLGGRERETVERLWDKEQEKFRKSMKDNPTVLRARYAYALLWTGDGAEAERVKGEFEKMAPRYPYPADIESERRLMELIRGRAELAPEPGTEPETAPESEPQAGTETEEGTGRG